MQDTETATITNCTFETTGTDKYAFLKEGTGDVVCSGSRFYSEKYVAVRLQSSTVYDAGLTFDDCELESDGTLNVHYGLLIWGQGAGALTRNISLTDTTVHSNAARAMYVYEVNSLLIDNCDIRTNTDSEKTFEQIYTGDTTIRNSYLYSVGSNVIEADSGGGNYTIENCELVSEDAQASVISMGIDGSTPPAESLGTVVINNNRLTINTGVGQHGAMLGTGCDSAVFSNNTIEMPSGNSGANIGLVLKGDTYEVFNNIIYSERCIYCKGGKNATVYNNTFYSYGALSSSSGMQISNVGSLTEGDVISEGHSIYDNIFYGSSSFATINAVNSIEGGASLTEDTDPTLNYFNNNCYYGYTYLLNDIPRTESVLLSSGISSLQSYWGSYATTYSSNDTNSIVADPLLTSAHVPQNKLVISGGTVDSLGRPTTMGAIQVVQSSTGDILILDKADMFGTGTQINDSTKVETEIENIELNENLTISDSTVTNLPAYLIRSGGTITIATNYPTYNYSSIPAGNIIGKLSENTYAEIRYTLNGKTPTRTSHLYTTPIALDRNLTGSDNTVLKYKVFYQGKSSETKTIRLRIV
jgi:hypothetical protein